MKNKTIIKPDQVRHIAKLANLSLSDKELNMYTKQISDVLSYMDILEEVDTKNVEPTYQLLDASFNIFREDIIKNSLTQEEALQSTNNSYRGYFMTDNVFMKQKHTTGKLDNKKRDIIDKFNAILTIADKNGKVGHKDLFITKGIETSAGSKVLEGYIPQYNSTVVESLNKVGLYTKYKLNQDAWGHGASGENSDFGPTKNPWNLKKVPGGSSSGSGVVVATGDVEVATATDTCGSVRMPASYCNVCGLKPTYGAVSRFGVIAFASSLDCPSIISNSVINLRKYFKFVNNRDNMDATTHSEKRDKIILSKKRVIGLPKEFLENGIDPEIKNIFLSAVKQLSKKSYKIVNVSLPHAKYAIAAYYIIAPTETSSNLSRYDGIRYGKGREYFGPEAKRRIMLGTYSSSAGYADKYYEKAARVRTLIIKDMNNAFKKVDAILAPVSPVKPYNLGEKVNDPMKLYLMDIYSAPASLSGLPALAVPSGFTKNDLPVGIQIIGPRWSEEMLFEVGELYQKLTRWHIKKPKLSLF